MPSSTRDKINFYNEFKQFYLKILKNFKFDYNCDKEARNLLQKIILTKPDDYNLDQVLNSIKTLIDSKELILIYGCGPSLEGTIKYILDLKGNHFFYNFLNLCADGSSRLLHEKNIPVDIIFTDLDGITKAEFFCSEFVIVHAHGDNLNKLQEFEKSISDFKNIIGTTQVEPIESIINPGGFTDGDRILFFIRSFLNSNHKIFLLGMDFDKIVGKYSKIDKFSNFKASKVKRRKLKYAKYLIEWIQKELPCPIYFVNSFAKSKKFNNLTLFEFKKLVIDNF